MAPRTFKVSNVACVYGPHCISVDQYWSKWKSLLSKEAFSNPTDLKCKFILTDDNTTTWRKLVKKWLILRWVAFSIPSTLESFLKSICLLNNFLKGKWERWKFWERNCALIISWALEETENHLPRALWGFWILLEVCHYWEDRFRPLILLH